MLLIFFLSGPCRWTDQLWSVSVAVTCLELWLHHSLTVLSFLSVRFWISLLVLPQFCLVVFCAFSWLFTSSLLIWSIRRSLYSWSVYVWYCPPLAQLMSLLLAGMIRLPWLLSDITADWSFCLSLCYDNILAVLFRSTYLGASATPSIFEVWLCVAIGCWFSRCRALVWMAWCRGVLYWRSLSASRFYCLCNSANDSEFLVFLCRHVILSLYVWGLSLLFFWPLDWYLDWRRLSGDISAALTVPLPLLQTWPCAPHNRSTSTDTQN